MTGDLVPGGRTRSEPNGDVNLGIYGLQQRVGAKRDGYMRPRGETVGKALKTLFGGGGQNTPKPISGARPATSAPAQTIDVFARAAKASPPPLPAVKPGGPDGIVLGGSVMAQSEGLTRRIETLAPRGYRFFPKMGSLAAHWVGPDLLPISEKRVQNLMRRFRAEGAKQTLSKPAAAFTAVSATSRNAALGGDKVTLPGQGGSIPPKKPASGSEAAVRGEIDRAASDGTAGAGKRSGPGSEAAVRGGISNAERPTGVDKPRTRNEEGRLILLDRVRILLEKESPKGPISADTTAPFILRIFREAKQTQDSVARS